MHPENRNTLNKMSVQKDFLELKVWLMPLKCHYCDGENSQGNFTEWKKKKRENKRPNSSTFQLERTKKMEQRKGME